MTLQSCARTGPIPTSSETAGSNGQTTLARRLPPSALRNLRIAPTVKRPSYQLGIGATPARRPSSAPSNRESRWHFPMRVFSKVSSMATTLGSVSPIPHVTRRRRAVHCKQAAANCLGEQIRADGRCRQHCETVGTKTIPNLTPVPEPCKPWGLEPLCQFPAVTREVGSHRLSASERREASCTDATPRSAFQAP